MMHICIIKVFNLWTLMVARLDRSRSRALCVVVACLMHRKSVLKKFFKTNFVMAIL